jgi:hypothetical protein
MPRALCLALTLLVLPPGAAQAGAPADLAANAALKYWQAFATLPSFTKAEQTRLNAECLTMPLDAQAREFVTRGEYSLRMLHRGAALRRCAWGVSYEDGIYVRIPHAEATRALSALACLRARLRFEEGRNAEALDDVVAAMTVGRHVSLEGGLIAVLFGYSVEHRMIETLAPHLPRLDARTVQGLKTRLDALPPFGSPATSLLTCEKETLDWFIREVKAAKNEEELLSLLAVLTRVENPDREGRDAAGKARAFLRECGGGAAGVLRYADQTRPCYDLLAKKLELPPEQFEKEFEREAKKQAGNPVFKLFFPALPKCRQAQARADTRRALLSAAVAVRLDGEGALKDHPDPVGGGPFEYVAFEGGFELRSKFKVEDKPLSLTVGRRGK